MRIYARTVIFIVCLLLAMWAHGQTIASALGVSGGQRGKIIESYGKLPLAFEANQGQSDARAKYLSHGVGYELSLTPVEAVLSFQPSAPSIQRLALLPSTPGQPKNSHSPTISQVTSPGTVLRLKLLNANANAIVTGEEELPGKSHYFKGNDPKKWCTNVPQFAKVHYKDVYPGVDLVYYGHEGELEYDFVVQPGADPQTIEFGVEGAARVRLEGGEALLTTAAGDTHLRSPHLYQYVNGSRHDISGQYVIQDKSEIGFLIGAYDRSNASVIDPVLAYSSYVNANGGAYGIAMNSAGNAYVVGLTSADGRDVVITKVNADGSSVLYQTYLGGTLDEWAPSIAVDSKGNAYVTGATQSIDFPTKNPLQATNHGAYDAFVTKISSDGSTLIYSTYLGGSVSDQGQNIAVDRAGNAYVVGGTGSTDFPTAHALQSSALGEGDAFLAKINATGSAFVYSTYLSGSGFDYASGVVADSMGNAYVIGATQSADFPTTKPLQPYHGGRDAFLSKINASGSSFIYSTFLGGTGEEDAGSVALDSADNVYLIGSTTSTDFPTVNPVQAANAGGWDVFATKINAAGNTLVYSTYLGGSGNDRAYTGGIGGGSNAGIAVDQMGNAYITGSTESSDFPILNAIQPVPGGTGDAFVLELNAAGNSLVYSTYLGGSSGESGAGIAVDAQGSAYVAGITDSSNFPTTAAASRRTYGGAYLVKIAGDTFVSALPKTMSLPNQIVGTTGASKNVTLKNEGATTLTIKQIYFVGKNPTDFVQTNTCGQALAPGTKCSIAVVFSPTAKGPRQAALAISDSDPASPQAVALSGTGTFVSLSATKLSFGNQAVGASSVPQSLTLTNTGQIAFNISLISVIGTDPGDFSQANNCGTSIPAGGNCTIQVTFKPTVTGTRTAAISVKGGAGSAPPNVTLAGTGK